VEHEHDPFGRLQPLEYHEKRQPDLVVEGDAIRGIWGRCLR
jgi:hypothetical protein